MASFFDDYAPPDAPPQGGTPPATPPAPPAGTASRSSGSRPTIEQLRAASQKYLGRVIDDSALLPYMDGTHPDWESLIANSPEARNYAKTHPAGSSSSSGGGGDPAKLVADYIAQNHLVADQKNPAALQQIVDYLKSQGINAEMDQADPQGRLEGIIVNGQKMQLIGGNGWTPLQPWDLSGGGESGGGAAQAGYPPFQFRDWTEPFTPPTNVTEQNDPGYQARLQLGQDAIQRSAAAKGTLLTGGTAQDLTKFGQDYASNEYANVYNRAVGQYGQRYNQYLNDYQNALTKYGTNFGVDTNLYGRAFNESQSAWQRYMDLANLGKPPAPAPVAA